MILDGVAKRALVAYFSALSTTIVYCWTFGAAAGGLSAALSEFAANVVYSFHVLCVLGVGGYFLAKKFLFVDQDSIAPAGFDYEKHELEEYNRFFIGFGQHGSQTNPGCGYDLPSGLDGPAKEHRRRATSRHSSDLKNVGVQAKYDIWPQATTTATDNGSQWPSEEIRAREIKIADGYYCDEIDKLSCNNAAVADNFKGPINLNEESKEEQRYDEEKEREEENAASHPLAKDSYIESTLEQNHESNRGDCSDFSATKTTVGKEDAQSDADEKPEYILDGVVLKRRDLLRLQNEEKKVATTIGAWNSVDGNAQKGGLERTRVQLSTAPPRLDEPESAPESASVSSAFASGGTGVDDVQTSSSNSSDTLAILNAERVDNVKNPPCEELGQDEADIFRRPDDQLLPQAKSSSQRRALAGKSSYYISTLSLNANAQECGSGPAEIVNATNSRDREARKRAKLLKKSNQINSLLQKLRAREQQQIERKQKQNRMLRFQGEEEQQSGQTAMPVADTYKGRPLVFQQAKQEKRQVFDSEMSQLQVRVEPPHWMKPNAKKEGEGEEDRREERLVSMSSSSRPCPAVAGGGEKGRQQQTSLPPPHPSPLLMKNNRSSPVQYYSA